MIGPFEFDMFTAAMFVCFSVRFLNMRKPRTTFHILWWTGLSGLEFYGSGPACLLNWLGMVNADWLGSMRSEIFLQMKSIIFQGFLTKQAAFLPGQPAPYNQLLIQALLLIPECCFHNMLKQGFWNFKSIFLRMQFSLVATIFL